MSSINTWANDQLKVLNQESNKIFDQLKRDNVSNLIISRQKRICSAPLHPFYPLRGREVSAPPPTHLTLNSQLSL